ncbi:MAG: dicarboxylate/amino acid:cation symporter [Deltaproteobacteria bacterium]|nr:MAG: dicarboxylate/amino acid:cation symporter [Deltaproteobacteria bacterium]
MKLHTRILLGMFLGVVLGLLFGPTGVVMPQDGVALLDVESPWVDAPTDEAREAPLTVQLRRARVVSQTEGWVEIEATARRRHVLAMRNAKVPGANTLHPGDPLRGFVPDEPDRIERYSLLGQTLVDGTEWIGRLFLALIQMVVVPLVFLSLVVGVASLGDLRALGRLGSRTLALFAGGTVIALVVGVALTNLIRPGALLRDEDRDRLLRSFSEQASSSMQDAATAPSLVDQLVAIVPTNPIAALAQGEMLPVIFFATALGVAMTFLPTGRAEPVVDLFDRLNDAIVMLVHLAMQLAPLGVAALLFKVSGSTGPTVLLALAGYCGVVLLGLTLHLFLTYGTMVQLIVRLPFFRFIGALREALLLAFSTSSSSAALPVTKSCVEDNLGVRPQVSSFVLPLGATVNMDGTALYQGVAAVFIAQIYGMDLSLLQQATVVGAATLASVGAAGVPGAGMITLVMVLTSIGVPTEGLALVLGVDRLLDMFRTAVNVIGDASVTTLIARLEGDPLDVLTRKPPDAFSEGLPSEPHPVDPEG